MTRNEYTALCTRCSQVALILRIAAFFDSSFARTLLVADRCAKGQQKLFRLHVVTAFIVRRVLEVSGVLERLAVAHNREDALTMPG
jgi:hypothetical protein